MATDAQPDARGRDELREEARRRLESQHDDPREMSDGNLVDLLHELEVHQAELEVQNEELRRTEHARIEARDRYRDLYEYAPVGYLTVDREGLVREANLTAARLCNRPRETLVDRRLETVIAPTDRDACFLHLRAAFAAAEPVTVVLRLCADGPEAIWVRLTTVADNAMPGRARVTMQDVTAEHEAETARRESEERFRVMADNTPLMIWVIDAEGRQQFVNRTWCEYFGLPQEAGLDRDWEELVHPDDRAVYLGAFEKALAEQSAYTVEARIRRADGQWRWVATYGQPRSADDGSFLGMVGSSVDITERKQAERQQEEFAGELAHQVQQQTSTIEANHRKLRKLAANLAGAQETEQQRIAEILHDDIAQILAAARLQIYCATSKATPDEIRTEIGQVDDLIREAGEKLRSLSVELSHATFLRAGLREALGEIADRVHKRQGVRVEVHISGSPRAVPAPLGNILCKAARELLYNVSKHAKTDTATIAVDYAPDAITLSVTDEGCGFVAGTENFDPAHGTGMGLFGLRQRLLDLDGDLEIASEPGERTCVTVTLPLPIMPDEDAADE